MSPFSGNKPPWSFFGKPLLPTPWLCSLGRANCNPWQQTGHMTKVWPIKTSHFPASEKDMWPKWANEAPGWNHGTRAWLVEGCEVWSLGECCLCQGRLRHQTRWNLPFDKKWGKRKCAITLRFLSGIIINTTMTVFYWLFTMCQAPGFPQF